MRLASARLFAILISWHGVAAYPQAQSNNATPATDAIACRLAVQALPDNSRLASIRENGSSHGADLRHVFDAYDSACLRGFSTLKLESQALLRQLIGFLFVKVPGQRPSLICTAFRLDTRRVATAAHCMFSDYGRLAIGQMEFRMLAKPQLALPIKQVLTVPLATTARQINDLNDFAVLEVDSLEIPFNLSAAYFRSSLPARAYLLIPGINAYQYQLVTASDFSRWPESLRVDKAGFCFRQSNVAHSDPRCVFSSCQTDESMSGAPIIFRDDKLGHLVVGGMHLRAGELEAGSSRECRSTEFNVGIALPAMLTVPPVTDDKIK